MIVPGLAYHVTHRGDRRGNVFFTPEDREVYRTWLGEYAVAYEMEERLGRDLLPAQRGRKPRKK